MAMERVTALCCRWMRSFCLLPLLGVSPTLHVVAPAVAAIAAPEVQTQDLRAGAESLGPASARIAFAVPREGRATEAATVDNAAVFEPLGIFCPQTATAMTALILQGVLIIWLLHERRERDRAEAQARSTIVRLTHVTRFAAAGVVTASISDELAQPLTGMVSSANAALRWLSTSTPDLDNVRTALLQVTRSGERVGDMISGIRGSFRLDTRDHKIVDINALVIEVLALVERGLPADALRVQTSFDRSQPRVRGSEVQLQQVLFNLMMNALHAMSATGARPRMLHIATLQQDCEVIVSITDAGVRLPKADFVKLFSPTFTTTKGESGMGLAICRTIIDAHNGRIWISPDGTCGTTVHFALPVAAVRERNVPVGAEA